MPTTSGPSHASTVPSVAINDRQLLSVSGWPNLPKLVASSNAIAGQSSSVADRISTEVDVSEASTDFDGATNRRPSASEFPSRRSERRRRSADQRLSQLLMVLRSRE